MPFDPYSFVIQQPYIFSAAEQQIIDDGIERGLEWGDDHFRNLRDSVRNHLRIQQRKRCGFCRLKIKDSQFYVHLEHIVPKTGPYRPYMFHPRNLVYCCQQCNFGKGTAETLINPAITEYPADGDAFTVVHPYHTVYSDHIDFLEGVVVIGKTDKGRNTIEYYGLARLKLAEDRASDYNIYLLDPERSLALRSVVSDDPEIMQRIQQVLDDAPNWIMD